MNGAVRSLDGMKEAEVDMANMQLIVSYDKSKLTLEQILQAIQKAGFSAEARIEK